jgi:hypothetical protein
MKLVPVQKGTVWYECADIEIELKGSPGIHCRVRIQSGKVIRDHKHRSPREGCGGYGYAEESSSKFPPEPAAS